MGWDFKTKLILTKLHAALLSCLVIRRVLVCSLQTELTNEINELSGIVSAKAKSKIDVENKTDFLILHFPIREVRDSFCILF